MEDSRDFVKAGITRRSFIKSSGLLLGTAGLFGTSHFLTAATASATATAVPERIVTQKCYPGCNNNCSVKITVRDGLGVSVAPAFVEGPNKAFNEDLSFCAKGWASLADLYNPRRLRYPMRRVGERGNDEWEQITWDEAIQEIADKWSSLQKQYGPNAVASMAGFRSGVGVENTAIGGLKDALGMPEFSTGADWSFMWPVFMSIGTNVQYPTEFIKYAKNIVIWGANPAVTKPSVYNFCLSAQKDGAKMVVIDPYFTASAAHADKFLPVRVGSDGALALTLINLIIKAKRYDKDFLLSKTNAAFLVKDSDGKLLRMSDLGVKPADENSEDPCVVWDTATNAPAPYAAASAPALTGTYDVNGMTVTTSFDLLADRVSEWTVEKAVAVTDVSAEDISELVEVFVNGPTWLMGSVGMLHMQNSYQTYVAYNILQMVTGNMAKPGAGTSVGNSSFAMMYDGPDPVDNSKLVDHSKSSASKGQAGEGMPMAQFIKVINTGKYADKDMVVKSVFITAGSLSTYAGRNQLLEAVKKLDFVLSREVYKKDSSAYSDILLPAVHDYEHESVFALGLSNHFCYCGKVSDPMGECKTDWELCRLIADKMGFGEIYFNGTEQEAFQKSVSDSTLEGWKYQDMQKNPMYFYRAYGEFKPEWIHFAGSENRAKIYNEMFFPRFDYGQMATIDFRKEALPYFTPPGEAWPETVGGYEKNALAEKYPLVSLSQHYRLGKHTIGQFNPWLTELDEPHVIINPDDAAARGIKHGDIVKVFNDRGSVTLKAYADPGMRPGVTQIPYGWPAERYVDGHEQSLGNSELTDPITVNDCFCDILVEIKKA